MIGAFISGLLNTVIYIFTKPTVWILLLVTVCVLLVGGIYPGAVYVYPFWQSKVNYVPVDVFEDVPLNGINATVVVPNRLIPDAERIYSYQMEFNNTTDKDIVLKFKLDKDKPYASFIGINELPIADEVKIPAGEVVAREYTFKIFDSTKPRDPVRITLYASIDGDKAAKTVILPIDYWSVPVVFIVGALAATVVTILRLVLWLWLGI